MNVPRYERRVSLRQLAEEEQVDMSTVWRWTTIGVGGHVLESFVVGRRRFTTRGAIARWVAARNGIKVPRRETSKQQELAAERAESDLDAKLAG